MIKAPEHPFDPRFTGKSIPRRGYVPKMDEQVAHAGWEGGIFDIPSAGGRLVYFNPAVREGKVRHLFTRECLWNEHWSGTHNRIVRFDIQGNKLVNPLQINGDLTHPQEQWEDPRILVVGKKTFMSLATWYPTQNPILVNQRIVELGAGDKVVKQWSPTFGKNGKNPMWNSGNEKNWGWFEEGGELHFVYQTHPHVVVSTMGDSIFGAREHHYNTDWNLGEIRGGTNPIRVGNEFVAFFHSSIPWKTIPKYGLRRRYFMGAYAFDAKTFKVTRMTMEPFLTGSEYGPTIPGSPAVVFPCGALLEPAHFYITYGINDCACGWVRIPINQVMDRMVGVK